MKFDQAKFLWLFNKMHPKGITQSSGPVITVNLRPQIQITHNFRLKNQVEVVFRDDGARFLVDDHNKLQEICFIHLQNKDCTQKIRAYCEKEFHHIEE